MTKSKQIEHIKEYFDYDSQKYANQRYPAEARTCDQYSYIARKSYVLKMLDHCYKNNGSILDIGCGPGVYTKDLLQRGWNVWGIDLSAQMIHIAKGSLVDSPERQKVHFMVGQVTALPFESAFFDTVLCIGVVSYIDDLPQALSEISRVLKPGGSVIFQISNKVSPFEIEVQFRRFLKSYLHKGRQRDADDILRERITLRPYRPVSFDALCQKSDLQKKDFYFYDFRFPVFTRLLPTLSLTLGKSLEVFCRSAILGLMGAGYLVRMEKK